MNDNILYFPYIRVPKSSWFTRTLLYWDNVGAIIPYDFIQDPEKLDEYTRDLVRANLVTQVIPGEHLWQLPRFAKAFLEYLESLGKILDLRKQAFSDKKGTFTIHAEKMFELTEPLEQMGLITPHKKYPWYDVERDTGREFMSYLAATLGKVSDLKRSPITDNPNYITEFIQASTNKSEGEKRLSNLREEILEDLLPGPAQILKPSDIENFKLNHGKLLKRFRRAVERELITIADLKDEQLRNRRLELFQDEYSEDIREIISRLKEKGWVNLVFGKFSALISSIPGVPPAFGLASAVYNAFKGGDKNIDNSPLLYAAYAQQDLLN